MLELDIEQIVRARGFDEDRIPSTWPILRKLRAVYEIELTE